MRTSTSKSPFTQPSRVAQAAYDAHIDALLESPPFVALATGQLDRAGYDPAAPAREGHGFGLAQVRERLATRYGPAAALATRAASAGGTIASIVFPLETPP